MVGESKQTPTFDVSYSGNLEIPMRGYVAYTAPTPREVKRAGKRFFLKTSINPFQESMMEVAKDCGMSTPFYGIIHVWCLSVALQMF